MEYNFPIPNVKVKQSKQFRKIEAPLFDDGFFSVNAQETAVNVKGVATYFARYGKQIEVFPQNGAEKSKIEYFLNNWGVVSILHQRRIINFHASSFGFGGKGIMICGDSGAGKSSLTASFCLDGAEFISDDITPVIFKSGRPYILPIENKIQLREETVIQLGMMNRKQTAANPFNHKLICNLKAATKDSIPLVHVFWINISNTNRLTFTELNGPEKFVMLRGEICGWEMLKGMRETEKAYMKKLVDISCVVEITRINRPEGMQLVKLYEIVKDYLENN